jgi:RNA-directed DNA polymerase
VLDEWFEHEVKPGLKGAAHEIRFADDAMLCFQYREDAEKVMEILPKRFAKYGLTLHPEKTRLVGFGRYAEEHAKRQGKKPATFDLGFTHTCARSRRGKFTVNVRTMKKRLRRVLIILLPGQPLSASSATEPLPPDAADFSMELPDAPGVRRRQWYW